MAQIRQEINILTHDINAGVDVTSDEIAQLDTTQYNGTVTYYFEVLCSKTAGDNTTISLRRSGTTTDDATIASADIPTTLGLVRSAAFTPPAGATSYRVFVDYISGVGPRVRSARIVIIQNATTITNTETQIEIGNASNTTATTDTALTNPKYWQYTSANWDGTITVYFEGVFMSGTSKSAATMTLQTSTSITAPSWSNVASSAVTTTGTVATRVRSGAITLTAGNWYRAVMKAGNSKSGITTYNAKIVVQQGLTTTEYYFDASDVGVSDPDAVWSNDVNLFGDNDTGSAATTTTNGSSTTNEIEGAGTNAPTSGESIVKVEARFFRGGSNTAEGTTLIYSASKAELLGTINGVTGGGFTSYVELTTPSGGWTWQKINDLVALCYKTSGTTFAVSVVRVLVTHVATPYPTKLEPQYLLANTLFAAGTGLQKFLTKWDSTEWDAGSGTIGYYFQAEAADNSTSDVTLEQADGGGTVTNSTLTNIDNAQISSAMTMPGNEDLDTKATTNAGDVAAARILVTYVFSASAPVVEDVWEGNQYLQLLGVGT